MSGVQIMPPRQPNRKAFPFVGSCLFAGIPIDIEQRKGDVREGVDPDGHKWRVKMHAHYGEVRAKGWPGAKGMDGDQLDVYVGPDPASDVVVVIDQLVPATGKVDEQKVMLGFPTVKEAVACYKRQYDSPGFYGGHIVMTVDRFKQKIANKENAGSALAKALAVIFKSGGPYIGPRGGKWADPQHTIPWKPSQMSLPMTRPTQPEWHERLLAVDASGRMLVDGFTDMKVEVTPGNVHAIESRLRGQNIETAVVIGGGRTFARRGTSDSVSFMEHERIELAAYGDCVATHNHPHDAPLSPTDVVLAINANLSEMRAVTQHGVFWVRRPVEGWSILGAEYRVLNAMGRYLNEACDAASKVFRAKLGEERHHEVMQTGLSSVETDEFNQVFHQQSVRLLPELQSIAGRDVFGFTPWAEIETAHLRKGEGNEGFERGSDDRRGDEAAAAGRGDSSGQGLAANLCPNEHARAGCRDRHSDEDGAVGGHRVVKADSPKPSISRVYSGIAYIKARRDVLAMRDGDDDAAERLASHLADHPGLKGFSGIVAPIPRSTPERAQHHVFARALVAKGVGSRVADLLSRSTAVESSRARRRRGKRGLSPEEHAASMRAIVEPAERDTPVLLVDDLFMGGGTIRGAALALRAAGHRGPIIGATAAHASRLPPWSHVTIPIDGVWVAKAGGPYIGPHGGKWADPEHTVHWEPNTPHNFRGREPLGKVALKDGTKAILTPPADGRDHITRPDEDAVVFGVRHEHDGRGLGYVLITRKRGSTEWRVGQASVVPEYRRNGLNSRLMDEASKWAHSRGESLFSGSLTSNEARAFYAEKLRQGRVVSVGGSYQWVERQAQADLIKAGGPYIGPRGGKWADPQHTIHWEDRNQRQISLPLFGEERHERPVAHDEHDDHVAKLDRIMDYGAACAAHVEWSKRLKVAHEALKAWDDDFANRPVRDTARMAERLREITDTLAAGHTPHGEVIRGVMFESVASATGTFALEQAELILRMRRSLIKDFEASKPGFRSFLKKVHREMVSNNFAGLIVSDIQHSGLVGVVGLRNDSHQFVIDEHVPAYMRENAEGWARLRDGLEAELSAWLRLPQEHHALAAKAGLRVSPVLTPGGHSLISGDANTGRHGPPVIRLFNAERHGEQERPHSVLCHEFGHIVEGVVNNARDEKVPPEAPDYFVRDETGNYRKKVWGLSEVFRKHCTPSRERRPYWDEGWGNRSVEWFAEAYRYAYNELHGTPEGMITNLDEDGFDRARFRSWVDAHVARALRGDASLDNEFTPNLAKGSMLKAAVGHGTIHRWADGKLHRKTQHGWEPVPEPSAMVGEHFKAGRDEYAIAEVDGDRVRVVPEHGGSGQWIPKASLRHFHDDLNGIVRSGHPETAPHPAIKGVLEGKGKYLGKGDDGVVFQHGDKVVKVSTTVPFQPMNPGHLTPKAAANRLEHQANVSEHLRKLGVPGLIEVKSFRHGDKSYQVRDHVEIPERLTKEQLDSAADTVHAIHKLGWALNDDVQVGVHDGKTVMYDTGKAAPARVGHLKWDSDQARDKERLARLYREHGLAYHDPGKPSVKDAMAKFKEALGGDDEGAMLDAHSAYLDAINHNPILARKADDELWAAFEEQDKRKLSKADGQRTIAALLALLPGLFKAGGPYIGPRGGKWANAAHTIAWSERGGHRPNHRRGHDKLTPSHQKARARLAKHELRIRDSHVEHVIVAEGKGPLHIQEGEASHALMRRDDVERWSRRGDAVLTHNHPSGMCFSESDMRTAYHANLAEIRAVTSSGVWSFVRPSDGWERPYHFIAQNNDRLVVQPAQRAMQSHVRDHGFDQEVWLDQLVHATHTKLHPALIEEFGDDVSYTRWPDRPGKKRVRRVEKAKGGPYIGPRGGKWADPQHTIPWKPSSSTIHRTAGTVSGHGSEHEPLKWSASGIVVGELHPGRASLGDLAKAILEGDNDPERAELTYQWLRDSWPKLQKVRTSEDLFSALDGYDDHVNAVLREREEARELERADKRKAVVEASQAHRKLHDPGRVTTPEKGAAWASGGAMPAPLYHATLAGSAIMASGLKAREDLRRSDGGRVESLGGGPDNTVSTTPDPNGARKIAAVFAAIAEAEENPEAVKSWLDKNWLPLVPPGYEAMLKEIEYADARPDPFLGVKARFNIISQIAGYAHPHVLVPAILAKPRVGELGDIGVVTVYAHVDAVMDDRGRVSAGPGAEMVQGESHLRVVRPNDVGEVDHGDLLHRSHAHLKTAHIAIASDNKAEQGEVRVAPEDATSVGFEPVTDWRAILSGRMAKAGGPYIGPRGGKWADPQHTIPWHQPRFGDAEFRGGKKVAVRNETSGRTFSDWKRDGYVYRGMSSDEYDSMMESGQVRSRHGTTHFADSFDEAESYASYRSGGPSDGGRSYLVEVQRHPAMRNDPDGYVRSENPVPFEYVSRIWEMGREGRRYTAKLVHDAERPEDAVAATIEHGVGSMSVDELNGLASEYRPSSVWTDDELAKLYQRLPSQGISDLTSVMYPPRSDVPLVDHSARRSDDGIVELLGGSRDKVSSLLTRICGAPPGAVGQHYVTDLGSSIYVDSQFRDDESLTVVRVKFDKELGAVEVTNRNVTGRGGAGVRQLLTQAHALHELSGMPFTGMPRDSLDSTSTEPVRWTIGLTRASLAGNINDRSYNGYYAWPQLGYMAPNKGPRGESLEQLMSTRAGAAWWRLHGDTVDATFDPTPGSYSMRRLEFYARHRFGLMAKGDSDIAALDRAFDAMLKHLHPVMKSGSLMAAMGSLALLVPQDLSGVYSTIDDGWATRRYARMLTRRADLNYEAYRDAMGGLTRDGQPMAARLLDLPEQARDAWLRHSGDEPVFDANGVWIPLPDEEGELRWGEMAKGAHHKYIARFPTGNPKRPWRYVYRYVHRATRLTTFDGEGKSHSRAVHSATLHDKPSRLLDSNQPIVVGMSFSDGVIGKHSGHWVVSGISKNEDYPSLSGVVVKHDVTGEERFFHDRFDLGDFVDGLHTEGLAAESSRRAAVIARNQDEVFDQMVGLAKSNATKDELQQLSKASYRLARLGGDKPLALARYFKVSVEPPKGWAKARAELEQLRSDLSVFCLDGSVRDYEHAAALMFVPDALRKWIRFRVLQDWVDSHVDSLDAHDFLRRLMKEHQLTGDESSDAVEAAVKKTLMVMYKDGSTSMRPSDVKAMSGWDAASRMLGDRDGYGMTDDGRVRRAKIKMALDDAFSARKIAAPTIRYGLSDRDEVVQKALKVGDRMTPSSWEPVTPEMLSEPPDNVQGLNPLTYMGSGVLMPFSVAIGRMAHASGRHEFLAKHRERMDAVRSVVAEVHSVCAPLLEAHSAQLAQDVYRDGGELRVVVRPVKAASPAEVVLPLLSKALGIPEDAAHRNAPRLISHGESDTVTISGPGSDVRGVTDDDRADAAPLFASVHPDVLPLVGVAHLPEAGRSYCNGNTVALHSNATRVTLWHEVGHAIEHLSPEISQAMRTYLLERSKGSQKTPLSRYGGYREDEHTYPDQWSNPYCGKWYDYQSTEILSMGLQNYLHDPVSFYRDDPEHFMLTAAAISGRLGKRVDSDAPSVLATSPAAGASDPGMQWQAAAKTDADRLLLGALESAAKNQGQLESDPKLTLETLVWDMAGSGDPLPKDKDHWLYRVGKLLKVDVKKVHAEAREGAA